jgi:cell division protein FtsZ
MEKFEEETFEEQEQMEDEPEAHAEEAVADEPEPAEEIEETPAATVSVQARHTEPAATTVRSRKTERQPTVVSRGVLAAVLSSQSAVASHVAAAAAQDEDTRESVFSSAEATHEPALAGAAARGEQQTFRLGDEDRGRFKDTEPSISDGEDLDVPTWMRLRKKTRH